MKRSAVWLVPWLLVGLIVGCGPTETANPPSSTPSSNKPVVVNIAAGRALFQHVCAYCHGSQGQGGVRMGAPALWGPSGVIKGSGYDNQSSLAAFIQQYMPLEAVNGVNPGSLTTSQANNVAAYILQQNK